MQQNIEFERCIDFLVRMIDKYGEEVLRELEEEKQNKEEKTAQNIKLRAVLPYRNPKHKRAAAAACLR